MNDGVWPAIRFWARNDLRRRWLALVAVGVLAGVTAGLCGAAAVGARQTASALERLRERTHAADAVVFASQVGLPHPDWSQLRDKPEVADLAVWDLTFGTADGEPGATLFASHDGSFGDTMTRPLISEGRMWDPSAPDEVVVAPVLAAQYPVGSTITFQPFGADQGDDATEPTGPVVTLRVVGVGTTVNRFLFAEDQAFISPGFVATYGDQIQLAENADVVLRGGAADVEALKRDVNDAIAPGTPVLDVHNAARRVETTLSVERTALWLLAGAIALAGALLVLQALARSATALGDDAPSLRAMGFDRGAVQRAGALSHLPAAAVAMVTAAIVAVALSPAVPVGLARKVAPDVGLHVDWPVVVGAAIGAACFVLLGVAWFVHGLLRTRRGPRRPAMLTAAIRRVSPVTVGLGATLALEPGVDRARVAVRPALAGAVIGVLGITAALTVGHAVDDALAHPERAGVTWSAIVAPPVGSANQEGDALPTDVLDGVAAAMPAGSALAEANRIVLPANGVGVPTFAVRSGTGTADAPIALTLVSGRAPHDGEAAIGPKTAADLGVDVGDTITLGEQGRSVTIVGEALFPPDVHAEFDEGVWVEPAELDTVVAPVDSENAFQGVDRVVLVRFPDGTDATTAIQAAGEQLGPDTYVMPAELPVELTNLRNTRGLPTALAIFLALLAVAAMSYVLIASSRRRRREFGIVRAMGLDRRSIRAAVHVQATTIAVVGLVLGLVLGVATGRIVWRLIAEQVPLQVVSPTAIMAILLLIPITLVVVNVIAILPARRASRASAAAALRAE